MKNATIILMILLASATTANAMGQPLQPLNPHALKPDLTPTLRPLSPAPRPVIHQAATSACGLSDFYVACSRR